MVISYAEIFRKYAQPLEPVPTGEAPALKRLEGIRAVLFDLYGTLLISASGEVGTARKQAEGPAAALQRALAAALEAMGVPFRGDVGQGVECLFQAIEASHAESRKAGVDYPEVDIVEIWAGVLEELAGRGLLDRQSFRRIDLKRLAVEYEARANPCWPMPHLQSCLDPLREGDLVLGIVSNAQFYTPAMFAGLLGKSAESLGFAEDLQYYSYKHGVAKPGLGLYELAAGALRKRRIGPHEAVCVGNDMLNDIWPAWKLGFRTALFAGDARSLRRRDDEPRLRTISPDLVLTDLIQLIQCIME